MQRRLLPAAAALYALSLVAAYGQEPDAEPPPAAPDCASGVVKDDGDPETGYGFVPSAKSGVYVQEFRAEEFPRHELARVCICFLKTRGENDAEFEVVFYQDAGGRPADEPYAVVPGTATDVPRSKETAGRFFAVDVSGVTLPPGTSWIGARWDPSAQSFLFVCTDTSAETEKVNVFFREDRSRGWASVFGARDPIFKPHRAILVRAVALDPGAASPTPRFLRGAASSTPAIPPPSGERIP